MAPVRSSPTRSPLRGLLAAAAVITVLVAGWLFVVTTWVLPERDPAHVAMWRVVACAYVLYAAVTIGYLTGGPHARLLKWAVLLLSAAAVGLGAVLVAGFASGRGDEGYLLLMGVLIAGHGLVAFLDAGIGAAIAKSVRAV
jgi:hypothetical protein